MELSCVTSALLLCCGLLMAAAQRTGVCTRADRRVTRITYQVASQYSQSYRCGFLNLGRCYRNRVRYHMRYQFHTLYNVAFECCYGYYDPAGGINCIEICQPSCVHGTCNFDTRSCDCSPGYTGAACQDDIIECDINNGNCDQTCTNTVGSFSCSCQNGFRAITLDASSCRDIDECKEGNHGCSQICTNTPGSHNCNCRRGFQLVSATPECQDVNECLVLNGFCSQLCVNTEGSYNCDCREGYQLFGASLCQDIDECSEMTDNCSRAEPAAECINTDGGFDCSCNKHTGYRLSSDGTTCEDVDECADDSAVCSMECVNTPGSYYCSCSNGYELDDDGTTCKDIDECENMTSGCQQFCTNTVGSYECSCERGYVLSSDGHTCQGLSCDPPLDTPMNGTIDCDRQTVGGTCNFTCDEGFTLRVEDTLSCLPSLVWSERPTVCDPPMCPELDPPENGFVLFPCTRREGDSCDVTCAHGYRAVGPTAQTCQQHIATSTLSWSAGPMCFESDPCATRPCANGGVCMRDGVEFVCVCNGTGFSGSTCNIAVVEFAPIQPVNDGTSSITIELSTDAIGSVTRNRAIRAIINAPGSPARSIVLRLTDRSVRTTVQTRQGIVTVTLPKSTREIQFQPEERQVLVVGGSGGDAMYFDQFGLSRGQLKPSCCMADDHLTFSCPGSTDTITLVSPCSWSTTMQGITRTLGNVFARTNILALPLSVSGFRYRDIPGTNFVNNIRNTPSLCSACEMCANDNSGQCYCYRHGPQNTFEFLQSRALGYTYISEIQKLLPTWLQLSVNQTMISQSSPLSGFDMFAPISKPSQEIADINGCEKLTGLMNSYFSVLRYDKTLTATIDGEVYEHSELLLDEGSANTMCFAVDMCKGLDSPVHMQISQPINDILATQFLSIFIDRQWSFVFNRISIFKNPTPTHRSTLFWNGNRRIQTPEVPVDVSFNTNTAMVFNDASLSMRLKLEGNAAVNYLEKNGYFDGRVELAVESSILNSQQLFKLTTGNTVVYGHISGNPCQNMDSVIHGISFMASYKPQPGELFFSRLFRFTETTQSCPFDAFIPVNSDYRALGLSLYTECPLLAVDELIFPEMTHKITFIGSRDPSCLTSGAAANPLVIESELISDRLPLGNILELKPNSNGPDLTTVFSSNSASGPVASLATVGVAIFGEMYTTQANIEDNVLQISASKPVFGHPAQYTISAASNETDWKDLVYTLQGSLLPGKGSFIDRLSMLVVSKLQTLAQSGSARQKVAQMSLDQARERYDKIQAKYLEAEDNVTQAEQERVAAQSAVEAAQDAVTDFEMQFNSGQGELRDLRDMLNVVCQEKTCKDVCMPGMICRECTRPVFIQQTGSCPVIKTEMVRVRVPPEYISRKEWRWVTRCFRKNYRICFFRSCLTLWSRRVCRGVCALVTVRVPNFQYKIVESQRLEYESCTRNEFSGFVPDTCCDIVNCAVQAPDPSCITKNAQCRSLRQEAVNEITDIENANRELFQDLTNARKSLSLAKTAARMADIKYEKYTQRRNQTRETRDRLSAARDTARNIYDNTLEEIGPLLRIHRGGTDNGFENIFRINSVTFNTKTAISLSSLGLTINFEKLIENDNMRYEEAYGYVSQLKEANLERIANSIIDQAFLGSSKRSTTMLHARARRQTEEEEEQPQRRVFESRCAQVINTGLFFTEIQTRLEELMENMTSTMNSTNQLHLNLTMSETDEEVQAYLELVRGYEELSMDAVVQLESTIFSDWQASMESLYSQSGSVGEVTCDGFADCIQTAIDELRSLVSLTPDTELSSEFVILFTNIDTAEEMVLDLALLSNITVKEGLARTAPIVNITSVLSKNNFWCNDPPVIEVQPPIQVNVSLRGTLNLSCEARSSLPLTYEWKKDGNVLPQFTTNNLTIPLIQRLDSANYTCSAINLVGTVDTIPASVTVYELPQFYLEPEPLVTFLGDDDGALFTCNATAWPYPGWRWYYRNSSDSTWILVEGEDTNELLIPDPQEKDEGEYKCEAFNYHGYVCSKSVSLTLLPISVSQYLTPVEFSVIAGNDSWSQDMLYDSIYSLLLETITGETATIENFNVTKTDMENYDISLNLVSRNITTPYTHLLAYEVIANEALPHTQSLSKSVQLIQSVLIARKIFPDTDFSVEEGSVVVGKQTYVCPPGQRLRSDYLRCESCERGMFSSQKELSRIVNGNGFSEIVPVCQPCPLDTYTDRLGSHTCLSCPKYHSTSSSGSDSILDCLPQPLVLECQTNTTTGHVSIDCKTNRPAQKTLCTFNDGIQHPCTYPVDINRDVSPLGNHSLTILVEDDEEFIAERTINYFLQDDIRPSVEHSVPPLVVLFTNDSPRIMNDSVEVDISLSRPVQSLMCILRQSKQSDTIEKDCSSGYVKFDSLNDSLYLLRVEATNRHPDKEFIKTSFEITSDPTRCTLHLINGGITISGTTATVEFTGRGPATGYHCHLDKMESFECSSPVVLSDLATGEHSLKIRPSGCGRNRMNINTKIKID